MLSLMALASWNQGNEGKKTPSPGCCFSLGLPKAGNFLLSNVGVVVLFAKSCSKRVARVMGILGSNGYFGIFFSPWRLFGMSSAFLTT